MIKQNTTLPELLAPAGSIETFNAAIQNGADAVYCGLNDFNARIRAKNFSIKTLSHLIPYAHSIGKRVYITLNTLIKQTELEQVLHILYQLEQLKVDALIVADPGLISIAQTHFPSLVLHGSTQMTIHNSAGVQIAAKLGLKRVVLARELTIEEIIRIKKNAPVELEVFIHGALCYSISGLCLASSFIGGSSGNRGRCTQVCRRKFSTSTNEVYCYSPDDFCAADYISTYCNNTITSLKIEGRMKNAEYVATVVRAYRNLLDGTGTLEAIKQTLDKDFSRPKTTLFLEGTHKQGHIKATRPSGTGLYLGVISKVEDTYIYIQTSQSVHESDRLRIHPLSGFEGIPAVVRNITRHDELIKIQLKNSVPCSVGDSVYKIGTRNTFSEDTASHDEPVRIHQFYKNVRSAINQYTAKTIKSNDKPQLWFKIDNIAWFDPLMASPCKFLLCSLDYSDFKTFLDDSSRFKAWRSRLIPCLPPFIPEDELSKWKLLISEFDKRDVHTWACSNIGQRFLFGKGHKLIADYQIPVMNNAAWMQLQNLSFSMFTYSLEDEYCNLKNFINSQGMVYLYAHVPLFVSRIHPAIKLDRKIRDPHKNEFFSYEMNDLYYTTSTKTLCLTGKKNKLVEAGISNFAIDLSRITADPLTLNRLIEGYKTGTRIPETSLFNFKAGLK